MAKKTARSMVDGPASPNFRSIRLKGNASLSRLPRSSVSPDMADAAKVAPRGSCVSWGIPFNVDKVVVARRKPVHVPMTPVKAPWLVFLHASDSRPRTNADGTPIVPVTGEGRLGEHAADYCIIYEDGTEVRVPVRRRREIGVHGAGWAEAPLEAVNHHKSFPVPLAHEPGAPHWDWGLCQTRVMGGAGGRWLNWLWAWKNPHPRKRIAGIRFEPVSGAVVVSAVSCGKASRLPLRWDTRRKALLRLPKGVPFDPAVDEIGMLRQVRLDMGQVISAAPRPLYPNDKWARTYNNRVPEHSERDILIEYTAHPDALFYLPGGKTVPVKRLEDKGKAGPLEVVAPSTQRVLLEVIDKQSRRPVSVKLHVHGEAGEYLAPVDRHRKVNPVWFEDYSVDFAHKGLHFCTYVPGRTTIDLPIGRVYLEVSKGFEIRPVRKVCRVGKGTRKIALEIEKVLPWRARGWVSADTHVHFLSPASALLEGEGEGVNVVNLLASQWGELMTNVGDFDGRTTYGTKESGGDGEYLVRVGTENRQHILGHISLLGYKGDIIAPMTTGGPGESALGDPVGCLLTEWAEMCRKQDGLVILPHFPRPRSEHAATLVSGKADGVEMTSWGGLYNGIDPYSLLDWYRYLNCGYMSAAVGGTDKMSAETAVGTVRTYAQIDKSKAFTYEAWKDAVRAARTFVTYGPLIEFAVEGNAPGSTIKMSGSGGTVDVTWNVASVTVPMSRVDLIVNGEVCESRAVKQGEDSGSWSVNLKKSSWLALLVRGHYADKPEIITAHSSPVAVRVGKSRIFAAADAVTILEQIEGALAYIDTVGTRAETKRYKEMRMVLTSVHRSLHNRMHREGRYHKHSPLDDHAEHHESVEPSDIEIWS